MRLISAGSLVRAQSGPFLPEIQARFAVTRRNRPIEKHRQRGAAQIDHDVAQGCGAGWDEGLMKFIAGGVGRAKQQNESPGECAARPKHRIDKRAIKQKRQHCVFRDMTRLADEKFDPKQSERRYRREKPMQERNDDARRMFRRHQVRRAGEDECHPQNNGQPVSKK
jgi:hypothetical protein